MASIGEILLLGGAVFTGLMVMIAVLHASARVLEERRHDG